MNRLNLQGWSFPLSVTYGLVRLKDIASLCSEAGMSNPLLVTDRGIAIYLS